jgi:hypothetical protein
MVDATVVESLNKSVAKLPLLAAVRPKQRAVNTTVSNTDGRYFNKICLKIQ